MFLGCPDSAAAAQAAWWYREDYTTATMFHLTRFAEQPYPRTSWGAGRPAPLCNPHGAQNPPSGSFLPPGAHAQASAGYTGAAPQRLAHWDAWPLRAEDVGSVGRFSASCAEKHAAGCVGAENSAAGMPHLTGQALASLFDEGPDRESEEHEDLSFLAADASTGDSLAAGWPFALAAHGLGLHALECA